MQTDFPLCTVIFKFHDYIYFRAQFVNLVMDLVQVLMLHVNAQTYHCIKEILNVMSIFLVVQLLNQEQLNV